jgi:hypothetical protein
LSCVIAFEITICSLIVFQLHIYNVFLWIFAVYLHMLTGCSPPSSLYSVSHRRFAGGWIQSMYGCLPKCNISLFTVHLLLCVPGQLYPALFSLFKLLDYQLHWLLPYHVTPITMVYRESVESSITDEFIWVYCCDADGDQGFISP